ncbi:zinc finger protein 385C isoform X1 [Tachysurus ichikawai]
MKHFYSTVDELGALTEVTGFDTVPSEEADFTRHKAPPLNTRLKSDRKHRSYTVCEVCNIQLNSAAQAQIHYNGKTHQKRLRHMKSGNTVVVNMKLM